MLDIFQCNFTNPHLLDSNNPGYFLFTDRSRVLSSKFCDGTNCANFNSSKAEALCREKKMVVKTIRTKSIEVLLEEAKRRDVDLRILLFFRWNLFFLKYTKIVFRDARPVFLSRRNANELPTYYLSIADYCSTKLEHHNFYVQNPALHHRLKVQTFEDLASNPETVAKEIYDFIKWDIPANLHSWIRKNTRKNSGFRFFLFYY